VEQQAVGYSTVIIMDHRSEVVHINKDSS
jgi:hypothetical protein